MTPPAARAELAAAPTTPPAPAPTTATATATATASPSPPPTTPAPTPPTTPPPAAPPATDHPALPRLVRLAPHRALLALDPWTRLIGLDPATAVLVEGLSPPLAGLLDALAGPAPVASAALVHGAVRRGAEAGEAAALLRRLLAAGGLVPGAPRARRVDAVALVVGDGPLAAGVATGLARAGLGAVHVRASGLVAAGDLGTGYVDADRGRPREPALAAAVRRVAPGTRTGPPPQRTHPDVAVLADALVPDPRRVAALTAAGTAHLAVRLRDGAGLVGPLVLPGRSGCLACADRHLRDHDPVWAEVATHLAGRSGRADPSCVAATAALATAQALAVLDVGSPDPPATLDATLTVAAGGGGVTRRSWPPHPRCLCRVPAPRPATEGGAADTACTSRVHGERIEG